MTRYHLEHRVPRPGERFLHSLVRADGNPAINTVHADAMGGYSPHYVLTEDRPKSDHPEALLIRVNGELYGRTYVPASNEAAYTSVNVCTDSQYACDITEWEDVYDEVPAPEPEPEQPTADLIRITAIEPGHRHASEAPTLAIRQESGGDADICYCTSHGFLIPSERITAWEPYQPGVRTVSSAEDLRTLPRDSVVRDVDGDAWQKRPNDTWSCASPAAVGQYTSGDFYTHYSPLTVVYTPKEQS